jgi:hypothetical protein
MRRRTFIAALGSAAAWPLVARARQEKVWRVGVLSPSSATKVSAALVDVFRIKLEELGYVEGKNLSLDVRRADDDYTRLPTLGHARFARAKRNCGYYPSSNCCTPARNVVDPDNNGGSWRPGCFWIRQISRKAWW